MVSVIIPIYNVEKYLRDCIESVLMQTFRDIEVILVDDGSPDNCGAICDEYAGKDNRIIVIHKKNGGLSDARNAGLDIARGEYILFVDSDDMLKKDAVKHLCEYIQHERAQIVYFNAETLCEDFEDQAYNEELIRKKQYKTSKGAVVLDIQRHNNEFYACAPLHIYERNFLARNRLRFLKGILHEDELFSTIAYVRAQRVAYLNEALYIRRLRAGSIMSERISLKSIKGISIGVLHILEECKAYRINSIESKALLCSADSLAGAILARYAALDKSNRKKAVTYLKRVLTALSGIKYKGSCKTKFKLAFPECYCLIRSLKQTVLSER